MIYVVMEGERADAQLIGYSTSEDEATAFAREKSRAAYEEKAAMWERSRAAGGPLARLVPTYIAPFNEQDSNYWEFHVIPLERLP